MDSVLEGYRFLKSAINAAGESFSGREPGNHSEPYSEAPTGKREFFTKTSPWQIPKPWPNRSPGTRTTATNASLAKPRATRTKTSSASSVASPKLNRGKKGGRSKLGLASARSPESHPCGPGRRHPDRTTPPKLRRVPFHLQEHRKRPHPGRSHRTYSPTPPCPQQPGHGRTEHQNQQVRLPAQSTPPQFLFACKDFKDHCTKSIATGEPKGANGGLTASRRTSLGIEPIPAILVQPKFEIKAP